MRIAVGGFQHETNTFAPVKAVFEEFERADAWPPLCVGDQLWPEIDGVNLPVTGAVDFLRSRDVSLVGLCWSSASPSAHVTEDAFERISRIMLDQLAAAGEIDAVYLDLHGAMVCEHLEDGEGELLRRVRDLVGAEMPIAVSLDLHANVTPEMVELADIIDIYRQYPHIDMAETGDRVARFLYDMVRDGRRYEKAFRQADFLIPLQWGCTMQEPAQSLYGEVLTSLISDDTPCVGFATGFPLADIHHCGPAVIAYGRTRAAADAAADVLIGAVAKAEADFAGEVLSPGEAVANGLKMWNPASRRPIVIADSQDNPGGGGPGDTTGMLRALIEARAVGSLIGVFNDEETAAAAHLAGPGGEVPFSIGGKLFPGDAPLEMQAKVLKIGDGVFKGTGPMWGGANFRLGQMALLDCEGVKVAIASQPMQAGDQAMFRHLDADPADHPIVVVKSSVHFRADFQPIAHDVLFAAAPGPVYADPGILSWQNLRPGVRKRPSTLRIV